MTTNYVMFWELLFQLKIRQAEQKRSKPSRKARSSLSLHYDRQGSIWTPLRVNDLLPAQHCLLVEKVNEADEKNCCLFTCSKAQFFMLCQT